jgi:predicted nucleic acid-binding Zn ribbon protein
MLFAKCKTCSTNLKSGSRICETCGALTGIPFRRRNEPDVQDWLGLGILILAGLVYLIALHTVSQEVAHTLSRAPVILPK